MSEIFHLFNIKTTDASKVYEAITKQEGLASWWTTETKATPEIGAIIEFRFTNNYRKKMEIIELDQDKKVVWKCVDGDEQWLGTIIKFEIFPKEGSTDLKFYHSNWKGATDLFGFCNYHWGLYMKSLKTYIGTGKGNPHKPELN